MCAFGRHSLCGSFGHDVTSALGGEMGAALTPLVRCCTQVFGGFASNELAVRIEDAKPKVGRRWRCVHGHGYAPVFVVVFFALNH